MYQFINHQSLMKKLQEYSKTTMLKKVNKNTEKDLNNERRKMSSSGQFIPPVFVYKRNRMKDELLDNSFSSAIGMISDRSFIADLLMDWQTTLTTGSPMNP